MDIATIVGLGFGMLIVVGAILMGGDFMTFVNVPSILIVLGGGFAATVLRFPLNIIPSAFATGGKIAFTQKKSSPRAMIEEITKLAEIVRKSGPLGLESVEISDDFLKKGVQYVADGYESIFILESLERERDLMLERLEDSQKIFKALGDAAPAFGLIGTLVGLVQLLSAMDDPSKIGPAMAVALLTTLYGALVSNLVCLPIADKLTTKSKIESVNLTLAIDGIMQLRENKSPDLIREMLVAYLPEKQRAEPVAEAA